MIATNMVECSAEEPKAGSTADVEDVKNLLDRLEETWKSHCDRGLKVRHEMGTLLNEELGSPTERLPHGEGVLAQAAKQLAVSESELSRMRWLAHLFSDVESLKDQQPECRSWTDFKRMLPQLKPANGRTAAKHRTDAERRTVSSQLTIRGVVKSIDNITARIDRLDASPKVNRCRKLLGELKVAVKACGDHMPVRGEAKRKDAESKASGLVAASTV